MEFKQVIIVRTDLHMGKGKIAAQVSHAAIQAMHKTMQFFPEWVKEWEKQGQKKVVLKISSKQDLLALFQQVKNNFPSVLIRDSGLTQIRSGEPTCIGIGPVPEEKIDKLTRHLKLL
jgi:PTH2 family peptidyl-tRNA hydrolase